MSSVNLLLCFTTDCLLAVQVSKFGISVLKTEFIVVLPQHSGADKESSKEPSASYSDLENSDTVYSTDMDVNGANRCLFLTVNCLTDWPVFPT